MALLAGKYRESKEKEDEFSKVYPFARHTGLMMDFKGIGQLDVAQLGLRKHLNAVARPHEDGCEYRHQNDPPKQKL